MGVLGIPYNGDSADYYELHCPRQVQVQLPVDSWYNVGKLYRSSCIGILQQGGKQRRACRGILYGLSVVDVHACHHGAACCADIRLKHNNLYSESVPWASPGARFHVSQIPFLRRSIREYSLTTSLIFPLPLHSGQASWSYFMEWRAFRMNVIS